MRSAGRLLLAASIVCSSFERVRIVLWTSTDPAKLVVLDCADDTWPEPPFVELWDNNRTVVGSGDDLVADRTCLHPPLAPRVKRSRMSRAFALAVAFPLSPILNLAVRLYSLTHPFLSSLTASDGEAESCSGEEESGADGNSPVVVLASAKELPRLQQ